MPTLVSLDHQPCGRMWPRVTEFVNVYVSFIMMVSINLSRESHQVSSLCQRLWELYTSAQETYSRHSKTLSNTRLNISIRMSRKMWLIVVHFVIKCTKPSDWLCQHSGSGPGMWPDCFLAAHTVWHARLARVQVLKSRDHFSLCSPWGAPQVGLH